ncbi:hypothetical protein BD413DRAFT_561144 [Trametes elegans]|nr:hypothetical protein BD413DRAFT_561144 [Trametes elegans]
MSVCPMNIGGDIHSTTLMIEEKVAVIIKMNVTSKACRPSAMGAVHCLHNILAFILLCM